MANSNPARGSRVLISTVAESAGVCFVHPITVARACIQL